MTSGAGDRPDLLLQPYSVWATISEQPSPSLRGAPVFSGAVLLYVHIPPAIWGTTRPVSVACRLFCTVQPVGSSLLPTGLG